MTNSQSYFCLMLMSCVTFAACQSRDSRSSREFETLKQQTEDKKLQTDFSWYAPVLDASDLRIELGRVNRGKELIKTRGMVFNRGPHRIEDAAINWSWKAQFKDRFVVEESGSFQTGVIEPYEERQLERKLLTALDRQGHKAGGRKVNSTFRVANVRLSDPKAGKNGNYVVYSCKFEDADLYKFGLGQTAALKAGSYQVVVRLKYNHYEPKPGKVGDVQVVIRKKADVLFDQLKSLEDKVGGKRGVVKDVKLGELDLEEDTNFDVSFFFKHQPKGWATQAAVQFRSSLRTLLE